MKNNLLLIAITMGDPAGVGPEVLLKFAASETKNPNPLCKLIVVGDGTILLDTTKRLNLPVQFNLLKHFQREGLSAGQLHVIDLNNISPE